VAEFSALNGKSSHTKVGTQFITHHFRPFVLKNIYYFLKEELLVGVEELLVKQSVVPIIALISPQYI